MACVPVLLVLLLFATAVPAHAIYYVVGDLAGWKVGVNYSIWSSSKTFCVGDNLLFIYIPLIYDVEEVSQSDYISCTKSEKTDTSGLTNITLTGTGSRYFICGISDDCAKGMKVAVTVSGGFCMPPSPAPPPSPSPSPTPAPPPS